MTHRNWHCMLQLFSLSSELTAKLCLAFQELLGCKGCKAHQVTKPPGLSGLMGPDTIVFWHARYNCFYNACHCQGMLSPWLPSFSTFDRI